MKQMTACLAMLSLFCAAAPAVQTASTTQSSSASAATPGAQASSTTSTTASAEAGGTSFRLAEGSIIHALLAKSVDAKKNKVGDEVTAKTAEDLKANGQVAVPKGSRVVGHITQVQARNKEVATSTVAISFDRLILKDGRELPLSTSIQAIAQSETAAAAAAGSDYDQPAMAGGMSGSGSGGGGMSGGGRNSSYGGPAGGGNRGATGAVANTAGAATGTVDRTLGQAGVYPGTQISAASRGVIGLKGLSLNAAADASQGSVISSDHQNVHLDSGTQFVLRVSAK